MAANQALQLVVPVTVTPAKLTDSNIPEPDSSVGESIWAIGTTYALGARVILVATNSLYESLVAGNVGFSPDVNPLKWARVSATNRFRMFDTVNSSSSTRSALVDVSVLPSAVVNALALLNVVAQSIRVRMTDPTDGVVFDTTYPMQAPPLLADWWNYFFDPITTKTDLFVSMPSYGSATIRVEAAKTGTVSIGTMILGAANSIGDGVEYGASVGIQDYSRKERNQWGDLVLVERSFARRASYRMLVPNANRPALNALLSSIRATPSLWVGVTGQEDTYIFGIYKDYQFIIEFTEDSVLTLDLEGLT